MSVSSVVTAAEGPPAAGGRPHANIPGHDRRQATAADAVAIARQTGSSGRRRALRIGFAAVGAAAMVIALYGRVPPPAAIADALATANGRWLLLAAAAQAVSVGMFAGQQRRLLGAFGVAVGFRRSLAITYARSAISISLPGGAAVSAGFAYREFRARGASQRTAGTVVVLSGILAAVTLGLLAVVAGLVTFGPRHPVAVAATAAAVTAVTVAVVRRRGQRLERSGQRRVTPSGARSGRWSFIRAGIGTLRDAIAAAAGVRPVDWLAATVFAALNWITDVVCLYAAARGVGLGLPLITITVVYLAVQVVRQVPITPGGVGLIEASLLVALVSAGAAHAAATAAVLIYRILSCWLVIPIGLLAWAALQAGGDRPGGREPAASVG
jgi:uncharacterized protein (TIRG00374 family)